MTPSSLGIHVPNVPYGLMTKPATLLARRNPSGGGGAQSAGPISNARQALKSACATPQQTPVTSVPTMVCYVNSSSMHKTHVLYLLGAVYGLSFIVCRRSIVSAVSSSGSLCWPSAGGVLAKCASRVGLWCATPRSHVWMSLAWNAFLASSDTIVSHTIWSVGFNSARTSAHWCSSSITGRGSWMILIYTRFARF